MTESCLPDGVHSSISALLDHLERKHGPAIVSRAVSYLTLSRTGLTEAELADLLAGDDKVLSGYRCQGEKAPPVTKLPQIDVEALLLDLRRFLVRRTVAGLRVLSWVSRHFKLVITKKYLLTSEARKEIHSAMADYFSRGGSCGDARAPLSNQKFDLPSSSAARSRVNARKILELPHHLQESGKWEQMESDVLMSSRFHQAMIQAGLLGDLVAMLESEEVLSHSRLFRERALIASVLKSRACFLQSSPLQLPTVMETNLLPYREVFPALSAYFSDIQLQMRERESAVGVALCPAPSSVPPVRRLKFDGNGSVADVAATDCGVVAQIMDDGTAWFGKAPGYELAKLSLTSEQRQLRFSGVKTSGSFVLLSAWCDRLFCWDAKGPEEFLPLPVPRNPNRRAPTKIGGFVACGKKLFTWWRNQSSVDMFDISDGTATHFQCRNCVTSFVCSSDGSRLYCGQEGGVVSLFDTGTGGDALATWSNPSRKAIVWMNVSKEEREIACGDETGNVALWESAAETRPPRLVKERSCGFEDVLGMDCAEDAHVLLVCRSRRVSLWDTCDWELQDEFSAPQGKLFAHAVLSKNGSLVLALLGARSFVMAWRVSTGECVLSLETNPQPRALLKTATDVV